LNTLVVITEKIKAGFLSLGAAWADTTIARRLMLSVLGGPAQCERALIRAGGTVKLAESRRSMRIASEKRERSYERWIRSAIPYPIAAAMSSAVSGCSVVYRVTDPPARAPCS
jgi:hypothetical protein